MLIRPTAEDLTTIAFYLGRIFLLVAVAGAIPATWAVVTQEWAPLGSFVLMSGVFALLGVILSRNIRREPRLDWSHGMVVVALTWLLVPLIGSIPLTLSGHYASPLDGLFDAMSGLTTTGLALIQDLDHLAGSLNFWRHTLHFLGGQGIIIAALSLFAGGGAITLYLGEARDERILPSVRSTARFIWAVAIVHLVVGVAVLGVIAWLVLGFGIERSLFHALMVFFAAFDTGGFAPQSTSIGYYHSVVFEAFTSILMVAGAMSFGVHFALWKGRRRATFGNLETRTILSTFGAILVLTMIGLAATGAYASVAGLTRQGYFQVLSAHTGTGFATISSTELAGWGGLAFAGIAIAMGLGGMASSTAGGIKSLRIALAVKTLTIQVKEMLLPERAVVSRVYYQSGRRRLTDDVSRSVMAISLLFITLYIGGAIVGVAYGVPLEQALFESISAGASVGLSVGVTDPGMPVLLKLTYLFQMWAGRLEFVAVFALAGFVFAWLRGR